MRKVLLSSLLGILIICHAVGASSAGNNSAKVQQLGAPTLVAHLPAELPQRVMGLAYDGQKLWVPIYQGQGRYATLDPSSLQWTIGNDRRANIAIAEVSGSFASPGAFCFVNGKLWVAGSYGDSFGSIDPSDWKIEQIFKGKQRDNERGTQSYSSMAYDGRNLWIVWHWFRYDIPTSETQLLLKVDPASGKVVARFPAPAGNRQDGTHGLTWDGSRLWHAKDDILTAIDPANGRIIDRYIFEELKRPSGLAWDGQSLWIIEFDGKVWRLPFA